MDTTVLSTFILPAALFTIMLGMGMSLTIDDFRRLLVYPKAVLIGMLNQLILLPIIGFLWVKFFGVEGALAVGMMIIAACPGGVSSNLVTHLTKADLALSISLTAISSVITVFTIPIIVGFALNYFMGNDTTIQLPFWQTIFKIVAITIFPVSLGIFIRKRKPKFADWMDRPFRIAATTLFSTIILVLFIKEREMVLASFGDLALVCIALNLSTMGLGYIFAKIAKLNLNQTLSLAIESGTQNGTMAIVIALSILYNEPMALPAAIYSIVMFVSVVPLMLIFGRRKNPGAG